MRGITVIIPTYNRQHYISQAIESVLSQDFDGEIEIVVSDDGSTDNTIETVEKYEGKIRIIKQPHNDFKQGVSGARNRGLRISNYPYICFLDSDDFFLPGHLQNMVFKIESNPGINFVFCRLLEMDENFSKDLFRLWSKHSITKRDIRLLTLSKHNVVQTNGFLFRRGVFDTVGMFDENLKNGEDNDLWMRISEIYKGDFSDHYGAVIRKHASGQLTDAAEKSLRKIKIKIFKRAIKRYKELGLKDAFRLFKLYYIINKYRALGIPLLRHAVQTIDQKKTRSADLEWKPLEHYIKNEEKFP